LLPFQSRLAIGDQRIEEIRFRLVEETKVGTPAHHVTNDVDTGLPYLGCHRVTSTSSTSNRCWISPPANVVRRHRTCLPSHGIGMPSAAMFVRPYMGDMAKRSFACPPSVTTLELVAPHRAMAS